MKCNGKVEHATGNPPKNIRVTYCYLETGHPGACMDRDQLHIAQVPFVADMRCEVKSPSGTNCGLPDGHVGRHENSSLGYGQPKW
jgi:hypothetical protein